MSGTGIINTLTPTQQLELIYVGYFDRGADAGGFLFWEGQYSAAIAAGQSPTTALNNIANSFTPQPETLALYPFLGNTAPLNPNDPIAVAGVTGLVDSVYHNLFNRAPDAAGEAYWTQQILTGAVPLGSAVLAIANGATGTDATLLDNKVVAASDFTTTTANAQIALSTATTTPAVIAEATHVLTLVTVDPASLVTAHTDVSSWIASGAGYTGTTHNLTSAADNLSALTGSYNVINGTFGFNDYNITPATFSPGDQIKVSGNGTGNVLNLSEVAYYVPGYYHIDVTSVPATVSGVEILNVVGQDSLTVDTTNAEGWAGLTTINAVTQSGYNYNYYIGGQTADTFTAAATTAINVTDYVVSTLNGDMTVNGGSKVAITESNGVFGNAGHTIRVNGGTGTTSVSVTQTATTGNDQNVAITDANSTASTPTAGTITSVTVNGLGANGFSDSVVIDDNALTSLSLSNTTNSAVYINEGSFATPSTTLALALAADKGLSFNDNGNVITEIDATVASKSDIVLNDTALKTLKIGGVGALTLDNVSSTGVTTIDASQNSGGVTFTDNWNTAAITGGSGSDIVTLGAGVVVKGAINLGAGNNSLLEDTGVTASIAAGTVVDGGVGGTNTISAVLVNAGNAATIKDFQIVDVSHYGDLSGYAALDTSLMGSPVSGVSINQADTSGTATILNLAANATLSTSLDTSTLSNVTLTHAGGTGTLAVTFNDTSTGGIGGDIGTLTSTGDTSVSFANIGTSTHADNVVLNLTETDNHLATVTVTGSQFFDLGVVHTDAAALAGLTADVASSLTKIDASASTGGVDIAAGASDTNGGGFSVTYTGLQILGGTGGDTITNNAKNGTITEGATGSTHTNTLTVSGLGASIDDSASAGKADALYLNGYNDTAKLGSGTAVTVTVADAGGAHTAVDSVVFGSGTANVTDNLLYSAVASTISANTNGNILDLSGTLHNESVSFASIANATSTLGAATSVAAAQTFDQAVYYADSATANTVTWFQYAGNTYIENSGAGGSTAVSELIKVTGLVDLSHAAISAGATLTFA